MPATTELERLIEPTLESMGFELVGVEYLPQGRSGLLRVYIDKPGSSDPDGAPVNGVGVTIDDCSRVSYQLGGLLDVEDPIAGKYVLEVSSPGLDRPLFRRRDFERFVGRMIKVRMTCPVASSSPSNLRRPATGHVIRTLIIRPTKRSKSRRRNNGRSNPGEDTSKTYLPAMGSSTSSKPPS